MNNMKLVLAVDGWATTFGTYSEEGTAWAESQPA